MSVSKNQCQLKTWGVVLPVPAMAPLPALLLLLLSIIATAAETLLYIAGRLRLLRLSLSVRPAVGCMLCAGESMRLAEHIAGGNSSSLPRLFLKSLIKNDYYNIFLFLTVQR